MYAFGMYSLSAEVYLVVWPQQSRSSEKSLVTIHEHGCLCFAEAAKERPSQSVQEGHLIYPCRPCSGHSSFQMLAKLVPLMASPVLCEHPFDFRKPHQLVKLCDDEERCHIMHGIYGMEHFLPLCCFGNGPVCE